MSYERIDLTNQKRFSRVPEKSDSYSKDRGIRRLKKGEIPHHSYLNTDIESTNILTSSAQDFITWGTITTSDVSPWIINTNDLEITVGNITNSISYSTISSSVNNIADWVVTSNNFDNYTYITQNYRKSKSYVEKPKSIHSRLFPDPFSEEFVSSNTCIDKLKSLIYESNFLRINQKDSISTRLKRDYNGRFLHHYVSEPTSDILDRLIDSSPNNHRHTDYTFEPIVLNVDNVFRNKVNQLKKRAPFIKRVYITNGGRSFDFEEFKFEMGLAKERFEQASKNI